MTITYSEIVTYVKRQLSIIGKRLYTKDGKNMFSDITLSSAEVDTLNLLIKSSAHDVEAVLKQFITSTTENTGTFMMNITNTRGDNDFQTRAENMAKDYAQYNTLAEYLSMTHPDIAAKYQRDAQQRMESLVEYVFYKKPPTSTANPLSATSSVS